MKAINFFILTVPVLLLLKCSRAAYLPDHKTLDRNPYGSNLKIYTFNKKYISGELISANEKEIKLLSLQNDSKKILTVPKNEIHRYYLIYAKNEPATWLFILPFLHGFLLPFSLIPNAIVANNANFMYTNRTLKFDDLKMFARFPLGIPPEIPDSSIK